MSGTRRPRCACVQYLEPRQLLSAAVPTLTGAPFFGTDGAVGYPATAELTIAVSRESKSGSLIGTITEDTNGSVTTRNFTGSVNRKGKLVLHIKKLVRNGGGFVILPESGTGTVSADGNTLTGKTSSGTFRGTFSATRVSG